MGVFGNRTNGRSTSRGAGVSGQSTKTNSSYFKLPCSEMELGPGHSVGAEIVKIRRADSGYCWGRLFVLVYFVLFPSHSQLNTNHLNIHWASLSDVWIAVHYIPSLFTLELGLAIGGVY